MNNRVKSFAVRVAVLLSFLGLSAPSSAQTWQSELNTIGWNLVSTPSSTPPWDPAHPNNVLAYKQAGEWGASLARQAQPAVVPFSSSTPIAERNTARQPVEATTSSPVKSGSVDTSPLKKKAPPPTRKVSMSSPAKGQPASLVEVAQATLDLSRQVAADNKSFQTQFLGRQAEFAENQKVFLATQARGVAIQDQAFVEQKAQRLEQVTLNRYTGYNVALNAGLLGVNSLNTALNHMPAGKLGSAISKAGSIFGSTPRGGLGKKYGGEFPPPKMEPDFPTLPAQ